MGLTSPVGILASVAAVGVAGLPNLDLKLGPMTALVGPRGSGKSQLLSAVAWLIAGRPPVVPAAEPTVTRIAGELVIAGERVAIARDPGGELVSDQPMPSPGLPACSFLRARDRFEPPTGATGSVGARLAAMGAGPTSDAVAAEALHDEIVRLDLRRGRRSLNRTSPQALSDAERLRLAAEFDHERSEMFFAQAVVLVEGQTERLSLPFIFRALGHDPDAEGIAIVEVGGKSNLPLAARILRLLEIPFVTVFDADRGAASAALDAEIRRAAGAAPAIRL